jgi:hypothetical protein
VSESFIFEFHLHRVKLTVAYYSVAMVVTVTLPRRTGFGAQAFQWRGGWPWAAAASRRLAFLCFKLSLAWYLIWRLQCRSHSFSSSTFKLTVAYYSVAMVVTVTLPRRTGMAAVRPPAAARATSTGLGEVHVNDVTRHPGPRRPGITVAATGAVPVTVTLRLRSRSHRASATVPTLSRRSSIARHRQFSRDTRAMPNQRF